MVELLKEYPPVLSVTDVAEILGVSSNTIRKLIKNNTIPSIRIGKRYKIIKTRLLEYLDEKEYQLSH